MNHTHNAVPSECVLVPPRWRLGVFVLIQIVVVVLVVAGCPPQTAVACSAGAGMAAAHVAGRLFGTRSPVREA